jgi:5-methylcytosine-specific restriction protein B
VGAENPSFWFVGASYGGTDDQTPRFLAEGIWENGYEGKYLDTVRAMQPGERIAIKAAWTCIANATLSSWATLRPHEMGH